MTAVAYVGSTGDAYVDGILSGVKWAVDTLTFSFPTDASYYGSGYGYGETTNNFKALTATQQDTVRTVLDMYSAVANLNFVEVTETASQHGELRYAQSDAPSTAWAYYPSTSAVGGDAWFNTDSSWYSNPKVGTYGFQTFLHETGHALGLKHAHDAGTFGAMPADKDSVEYTVMSYHSYVGSPTNGYTVAQGSYPQTLMMYDIAANQYLYGANYDTNAGDTIYRWNPTTGEMSLNGVGQGAPYANKVFMTVWDGGGNDTYDFSNYTGSVTVNLAPGGWTTTSTTQLASLGSGHLAAGNIANALVYNNNLASLIENAIGTAASDVLVGNVVANRLTGGSGNDFLDGAAGNDTAVYFGTQSNYSVVENADRSWTVTDLRSGTPDGTDTLWNIEWLQFSDGLMALGEPSTENLAPSALADSYSILAETELVVSASQGVLANDSDPDGDPLSAILVSGPNNGSLALAADGSFVFTPDQGFAGTTGFSYRASDGDLTSDIVTVSLTVNPPTNTAPDGSADSYATTKRTQLVVDAGNGVLANDHDANGDALTAVLVEGSADGSVTLATDGSFVFNPKGNFSGTTSFTYVARDTWSSSDPITVTIEVTGSGGGGGGGKGGGGGGKSSKGAGQDQLLALMAERDARHQASDDIASHTVESDQIPAPIEWSDAATFDQTALLLAELDDVNLGVSDDLGTGHDEPMGLAGVPDFMHHFYSEFSLSV